MRTLYSYIPNNVVFLILVVFTQHAMGENYALLIGVSEYPNLEAKFQLEGPANDMRLMQEVLRKKGFADEHIQILADGVNDAIGFPTRWNILAAMDNLTKKVTKTDFVYLHFAGHGSQQPAKEKSLAEPDGRDEIFLPRDVGNWDDGVGVVENAIVDNEIKHHLTQLRQNSALVWVVFDSCHSGTMTRKVEDKVRVRGMMPYELGIPSKKIKVNQAHSRGNRSFSRRKETALGKIVTTQPELSPLVAFYAAQTAETTPEMPLPTDQSEQNIYGLFTYALAEVLENYNNMTYRQAGQLILNHYAVHNISKKPTPLFEGHLDRLVFKKTPYEVPQQWLIKPRFGNQKFKINAGRLHQLGKGSILAVVPDPTSDEILGYVEITRAKAFKSYLKSLDYVETTSVSRFIKTPNGSKKKVFSQKHQVNKPALQKTPPGAYARLVASAIDFSLTVALPPTPKGKIDPKEARTRQLLNLVSGLENTGIPIQWVVAENTTAYLRLLFESDKLWLLPADTRELIKNGPNRAHSISLDKTKQVLRDTLMDSLQRIAKVRNLLRLSKHMNGKKAGVNNSRIKVSISINRQNDKLKLFEEINKIPTLFNEDEFAIHLENTSHTDVDVTVLYINSRYGISTMFPIINERTNRIEAKGSFEFTTQLCLGKWKVFDEEEYECVVDDETIKMGMERLVVIAVKAQPNAMETNFSFLSQPLLPSERDRRYWSDVQINLDDLFTDAVFGTHSNRDMVRTLGKGLSQTTIQVFNWQTSEGE